LCSRQADLEFASLMNRKYIAKAEAAQERKKGRRRRR
jgi:hypothetical protein